MDANNYTGPRIISEPHNTTVRAGSPVSVSCTVERSHLLHHQLLWKKGDVFVSVDKDHSFKISQHDYTNTYKLIVHTAVNTANYTCVLVSSNRKIVDSVTQYMFVDKTG